MATLNFVFSNTQAIVNLIGEKIFRKERIWYSWGQHFQRCCCNETDTSLKINHVCMTQTNESWKSPHKGTLPLFLVSQAPSSPYIKNRKKILAR